MARVYALKVWKGRVSLADITEQRGDILFRVSGEFFGYNTWELTLDERVKRN